MTKQVALQLLKNQLIQQQAIIEGIMRNVPSEYATGQVHALELAVHLIDLMLEGETGVPRGGGPDGQS